ncbi:MAG: hypothetical protein ABIR11_03815 [Candidatus Limnocylindrales bacterium]
MSGLSASTPLTPITIAPAPVGDGYVPGVCNIGPWEIRKRRTIGIVGFVTAAIAFAALVALHAPALSRLVLFLPLMGGTFSWLQARRHFCAGFAFARITNFGDADSTRRSVEDEAAHRADMAAVARMIRDAFLISLPITIVAVLLPL